MRVIPKHPHSMLFLTPERKRKNEKKTENEKKPRNAPTNVRPIYAIILLTD
jgi:hypothetical protein